MKNPKILRPAISLVICVIAMIACLSSANKFKTEYASVNHTSADSVKLGSYSVTDYSYYGGDAYTGIQQAGADASNNVVVLGMTATEGFNMLQKSQKNAANNVAALAAPLNAAMASVAAIGSMLSTAMALAFALPGVNYLFELIQAIREEKEASAVAEEIPAACETAEESAEIAEESAEIAEPEAMEENV